jgi:hypothetical protein
VRRLRRLCRTAATIVVVGALVTACGGEEDTHPAPTGAPPATETPKPPSEAGKAADEGGEAKSGGGDGSGGESGGSGTGAGGGKGGGGSGGAGGSYDAERPDAEGNDVPPPPGSPAERFERTCERNPRECY